MGGSVSKLVFVIANSQTHLLGNHFKVEAVKTMADFNRLTIQDVQNADILVVATTVLRSDLYFKRLSEFAGTGEDLPVRNILLLNTSSSVK